MATWSILKYNTLNKSLGCKLLKAINDILLHARMNDKSKNLIFDKIFLNVHFSIPIAYTDFKFCLVSLHINSEGTMSQIFNLGLSFHFM